jgi:hypothetical protein
MASSAGSRRRRVSSSAVPSTEHQPQHGSGGTSSNKEKGKDRLLLLPGHSAAAATTTPALVDDADDHHVPRLLKPLPQVPWHRPSTSAPAAAWAPGGEAASAHHRRLLTREDAPPYLTGNPFVLGGFRRCETLWEAVDGLWYMHNAWWDAWTSIGSFLHSHV